MGNQEDLSRPLHVVKEQRTSELLATGLSPELLGVGGGDMYDAETRRCFPESVIGTLVEIV